MQHSQFAAQNHADEVGSYHRRLLVAANYGLQSNRKTKDGTDHPDRNEQFEYIATTVQAFQQRGQPVISVDTKKKDWYQSFER